MNMITCSKETRCLLGECAVRVQGGKGVKAMSALEKKAGHQGQCLEQKEIKA